MMSINIGPAEVIHALENGGAFRIADALELSFEGTYQDIVERCKERLEERYSLSHLQNEKHFYKKLNNRPTEVELAKVIDITNVSRQISRSQIIVTGWNNKYAWAKAYQRNGNSPDSIFDIDL